MSDGKPNSIPSAAMEFRRSIEGLDAEGQRVTTGVQYQLVLGLHTLGAYLVTLAGGRGDILQEGQRCLARAVALSQSTLTRFQFNSWNSFAESFVGKLHLSMGDRVQARTLLQSAVNRFDRNWRAWWFLGRVNELDGRTDDAMRCFEKSAAGQASPSLFGQLRSIVREIKGAATTVGDELQYSKKAYELDPEGALNPKNISDYGYDVYRQACDVGSIDDLRTAESLLLKAYERYLAADAHTESNFPLWYSAEARERILGYIDEVSVTRYIEATRLSGRQEEYSRLRAKVGIYATRVWQAGQRIGGHLVDSIKSCADLHLEYEDALLMAGIVLQRNRHDRDALPYLESARRVKDTYGLRALMECYISLHETAKAREVFYELLPLLPDQEQQKLGRRAASLGLSPA